MKDEWKCVLKGDGELYLMMDGRPLMLKLSADNWDIAHMVSFCIDSIIIKMNFLSLYI